MNNTSTLDFVECPTCLESVQSDLLIPAGETHVCSNCRDEYLQRMKEGVPMTQNSEWAAIRQQHIKHEASLRSVGVLYYIGAIFGLLAAFGMLSGVLLGGLGGEEISMLVGILVFYFIFGIASIFIGRGLRQLRPWVKIPVTIFSGLGLLSIPIGTLINGYILYLMYSEKGKVVFSPEYQEIRDATPDIKYQTSKLAWGVLIVLVIALVAIIVSVSVG